jgi:flagellar M-ring protein FliF
MERARLVLASIQKYTGQLSPSQKMLVASLVVTVLLGLFVVSQFAGRPAWAELLPGANPAEQQKALAHLQQVGLRAAINNGKLVVPPEQESQAIAQLSESGKLPSDMSQLFKNILDKQSWYTSRQQSEQFFLIDLQNLLGRIISNFSGVKAATVVIDIPPPGGLGVSVRKPTASATIFMQTGRQLEQGTVDAAAGLIAGARAGLDFENIRVIDGSTGRPRKPTSAADALPTTYLEHAARVEHQTREKLQELLSYIPGVIVAVTAQVDVTSVSAQVRRNFDRGQGTVALPRSESTQRTNQSDSSRSAEPGVRSNTSADINSGSRSGGTSMEQEDSDNTMENHVGSRFEKIIDPRGMPTFMAASVNVPRSFVVSLLKSATAPAAAAGTAPAAPTEPTEAEIDARFAIEKVRIEEAVQAHVKVRTPEGELVPGTVTVAMIPFDVLPPATNTAGMFGGLMAGGGGGGGLGGILGGGLFDKLVVGVLAAVAMGMMLTMVRKAGRKLELPTAEQLVGKPPALETRSEVIGEADESESAMEGIEVADEEVAKQKMLESVQQLVTSSPETAAKLVNRWVAVEE